MAKRRGFGGETQSKSQQLGARLEELEEYKAQQEETTSAKTEYGTRKRGRFGGKTQSKSQQLGARLEELEEYKAQQGTDTGETDGPETDITKMTRDELREYIKNHPEQFEGMSTGDFSSWMWENWTKWQEGVDQTRGTDVDYVNRANTGTLFGIFKETPLYKIPDEAFQKMEMFQETALAGLRGAIETRQTAMETMQRGVDESLDTLGKAREEALGFARKDIDRIRDIGERAKKASLDQAYAARRETLAELQRGGDRALNIQRLQAFGGLPGERMTREQMNANFAATQQAIKERAGGGSAALGAIAEGYGQQQDFERQLAVDRAQYQAQGMAALAEGEFAQSGRMASAIRQGRMDIAGIEQVSARDMSQAYLDTSKYYTGMMGDYAGQISGTQLAGGQLMSGLDVRTSQAITDAAYRGADVMASGFNTLTEQREKQFLINQYEPYMSQRTFLMNELQRLDPFGIEAQYYGDLMGQGQSQYLAGVAGQNQAANNAFNAFSNTMATVAAGGLMYGDRDTGASDWMRAGSPG
jgi:uncharacterized coiled-coil protein SlyX